MVNKLLLLLRKKFSNHYTTTESWVRFSQDAHYLPDFFAKYTLRFSKDIYFLSFMYFKKLFISISDSN